MIGIVIWFWALAWVAAFLWSLFLAGKIIPEEELKENYSDIREWTFVICGIIAFACVFIVTWTLWAILL